MSLSDDTMEDIDLLIKLELNYPRELSSVPVSISEL